VSDFFEAVGDVFEGVGDLISGAFEAVGDVLEGIGGVITDAVEFVGQTVTAILEDPLPTLLQIGGSMIGIPPYVTSAAITAARGGDLGDIAKSAAISYASTEFMSSTQIGADIKNYTVNQFAGDFTDTMMENFNLTPDQAVQVSRVATASLNSSLVGGINAALSGRSVMDGIASGFKSGLVYSSTDSYFDSLNKDPNWGFTPQSLNLMKGAASTALNTIVSGKGDPAQAVGNYIAYAAINLGTSKVLQAAKDTYKVFMTDTEEAEKAQDKYTTAKAEYDTKVKDGEVLRNEINESAVDFKNIIDNQFTPFKVSYDEVVDRRESAIKEFNTQKNLYDYNKSVYDNYEYSAVPITRTVTGYNHETGNTDEYTVIDGYEWRPPQESFLTAANAAARAANAAVEKANIATVDAQKLLENNKPMLDALESKKAEIETKQKQFDVIKADIEAPNADGTNTAAKVKAAADEYQSKYEAWSKTKEAADRSAENYTKALAEVASRDALIDTLNSGALKVTSKDADGNWKLSNGMTLTTQGKFIQDGVQVFENAAGIPQKSMDFTAQDGSNVDFDGSAGRVMSETDVSTIAKRDFGLSLTDEEAANLAGGMYTDQANNSVTELANQKARDTYVAVTGKEPTASELDQFRRSGNVIESAVDAGINGLDLPPDYVLPNMSVQEKISRGQAYAAARAAYGPSAVFDWTDPKTGVTKQYTTENFEEKTARLDRQMEDSQNRINMMPANDISGAGRGFLGGPPAGVENIYYGKKDDNVYVDTRTFDAMGNVTGGSLRLADDKTATNVRATNIIEQLAATGAQGLGDLLKSYATTVSLASGSDMDSVAYKLGKTIEQWGKDRDGEDVVEQTNNMKSAVEAASKEDNFFKQGQMIIKAAADNPIGMISFFGKEAAQETPGWAIGALGAAGVAVFGGGVTAVALTGAALAAAMDGLEAFGSGGREAYDALKKAGVPEELARDKAIINGSIHAAVVAPAEFIADKTLFKAYLNSVSGGIKEYAAKYGSTIATNAASEFLSTVPSVLSTQAVTTGKTDLRTATAEAWFSSIIGAGTVATVLGPAAINDAVVVAKDYAGNDVTLGEFMSGFRDVDLETLDSSATIGTMENGGQMTVGALAATGTDLGLSSADLKTFLPSSVTDYSSVVYKSADGTPITLGNIDFMVAKNPALDFTTVLDTVYKTGSSDFSVVFSPSVLNGTAPLQSASDYEATALSQGFPSYAAYQQYGGDVSLYQNTQNNNLATAAGFPDYATYTSFNGDKAAYDASKVTPPVVTPPEVLPPAVTPPVVTPPVVTPPVEPTVTPPVESPVTPPVTEPVAPPVAPPVEPPVVPPVATPVETPVQPPVEPPAPPVVTPVEPPVAPVEPPAPVVTPPEPVVTPPAPVVTPPEPTVTPPAPPVEPPAPIVTPPAVPLVTIDEITLAINNAIADAKAAGLSGDQALRNAIDTVAANQNTSAENLLSKLGTTEAGLKTEFAAGLVGVQTDISNVQKNLQDAMAVNEAAGLSRDQAAAKAISDVAASVGTTKEALLAQMGVNEASLRSDLASGLAGVSQNVANVEARINAAIAANEAAGMSRNQALTKAIDDVAASAGQTKADLLAQLGQAESGLRQEIAESQSQTQNQIANLSAQAQAQYAAMTAAQQAEVQARVTQGQTLQNAITASQQEMQQQSLAQYNALSAAQKAEADARIAQGQTLQEAIAASQQATASQISALSQQTQQQYAALTAAQKAEVDLRVQQGVNLQTAIADSAKATTEQIGNLKTDLTKNITDVQTQFNARVDELLLEGKTYQEATNSALKELGTGVTGLQTGFDEYKKQQEAAAKEAALQAKRATSTSSTARNLAGALSMIAPAAGAAALVDTSTPGFKDIGYKNIGEAKFESVLSPFEKMVEENFYAGKPQQQNDQQNQQPFQQAAPVNQQLDPQRDQQSSDYFNYGTSSEIDQMLGSDPGTQMLYSKAGGLATPLFAGGGTTRHGKYAGGGLNVVQHSGKARLDFRKGDAVTGPGDGQSDDIPAMLADGEFVFPADVVAALGNGSTKAGSDKLYDMMHSIRAYHRSAKPKDLPPPAKKSPLDYLTKTARKARR
jgi:hypothetical protein